MTNVNNVRLGMDAATDVVISGCSAGNLFTVFICVISPLCEQFL
jgi:hypothetical protein